MPLPDETDERRAIRIGMRLGDTLVSEGVVEMIDDTIANIRRSKMPPEAQNQAIAAMHAAILSAITGLCVSR
jgi:hypothetical protein